MRPTQPEPPKPRLRTLSLLVGRVTTIKLAYWAVLTAFELALPSLIARPIAERVPFSIAVAVAATVAAVAWAAWSARAVDRRLGSLERSIPTVATTFVAANVVAAPASLPLLIVERQRSIEGCPAAYAGGPATCNVEALLLWVAVVAVGMVVIPAAFALALRRDEAS